MNRVFTVLLLAGLTLGCKKPMSPAELKTYVSDPANGLVKTKSFSGLSFQMDFMPAALFNLQGGKEQGPDYAYFIFRVKMPGSDRSPLKALAQDKEDYFNRLYYVQTKLQKDFTLTVNGKTCPCVFLNYEDDHNILPELKVLLAFEPPADKEDWTLHYEDNLFGMGLMNFKFKQEHLENIPQIKL